MSRPNPSFRALSKSLHGRAITVTAVTPAVEIIHQVPAANPTRAQYHRVTLNLTNPSASALKVLVHYNNGASYHTIPAHDTVTVVLVIEGDSPICHVANADLAVSLATGESGTFYVTGGYER